MSTKFYAGQKDYIEKLNQLDDAFGAAIDAVPAGAANATQTAADRAQTGQDRVATGQDKAATAADRTQTAADRVGTGQDKTATAADRVVTGQDRVQTGQDKAATAADRVGTGQDRVATGQDKAATAADRVQTGQDRAQTGNDRIQTQADRAAVILERQTVVGSRQAIDAAVVTFPAQVSAVSSALSNALAIYGSISNLNAATAIMLGYANTAKGAVSQAQAMAAQAASVVQQDLSGVLNGALHRSPSTVVAQAIYDTSKDSDGGAWVDKCNGSYLVEPLNGRWLGCAESEAMARLSASTLGPELTDGAFDTDISSWNSIGSPGVQFWSNGALRRDPQGATSGGAFKDFATVVGKQYALSAQFTVVSGTVGVQFLRAYHGASFASPAADVTVSGQVASFIATSTTVRIYLYTDGDRVVDFDNVSLRQVVAFSARSGDYYQRSNDGSFYRLSKNMLKDSRDFTAGSWSKGTAGTGVTPVVIPNSAVAPDGSMTATTITFDTGTGTSLSDMSIVGQNFYGAILGLPYAGTLQVKGPAGKRFIVRGVGATNYVPFTFDGTWQTLTSVEVAATTNVNMDFGLRQGVTADLNSSVTFAIAFVQQELGSVFTSEEVKGGYGTESPTFRGNTAKFPRLAAIVAEATNVTIYALDQPGRPMWMRFDGLSQISSLAIKNAHLLVGRASGIGVQEMHFALDYNRLTLRDQNATRYPGDLLSLRNSSLTPVGNVPASEAIINASVYGVAMAVMPDAPVNPATGLQVPTIAVATSGGVSVIKHDGTVVNSGDASVYSGVVLTPRALYAQVNGSSSFFYAFSPSQFGAGFALPSIGGLSPGALTSYPHYGLSKVVASDRKTVAGISYGPTEGRLAIARLNESAPGATPVAWIGRGYNTGYMVGDIRRAVLCDTAPGALTSGRTLISAFDAGTDGWTAINGAALTNVGGKLRITSQANSYGAAEKTVATVAGKAYRLIIDAVSASSVSVQIAGQVVLPPGPKAALAITLPFTALTGNTTISLVAEGPNGYFAEFDNIYLEEAVAERSYKDKHIGVNGTLVRTAVAGAAQLVGFSGFSNDTGWSNTGGPSPAAGSAANVLQEPYSAELNFSTGTWAINAKVNVAPNKYGPHNLLPYSACDTAWSSSGATPPPILDSQSYLGKSCAKVTFSPSSAVGYAGSRIQREHHTTAGAVEAGQIYGGGLKVSLSRALTGGEQIVLYFTGSFATDTYSLTAENSSQFVGTFGNADVSASVAQAVASGVLYPVVYLGGALSSPVDVYVCEGKLNRGSTVDPIYWPTPVEGGSSNGIAPFFHRGGATGPYITVGVDGAGMLAAEAYDGTSTRRVTSLSKGNTGSWQDVWATYSGGALAIGVNGKYVSQVTGDAMLTMDNANAPLTIGNDFTLRKAFPGSVAMVKVGVTVPTADAVAWMHAQEKQMFREGAQVALPDAGVLVDLSHGERTNTWITASATNSSEFNGLVRSSATPVAAGWIVKLASGSGVKAVARSGLNSGVDVTIPAQNLKEELQRRSEDAKATPHERAFDFDATAGQTEFALPVGWEAMEVIAARSPQREGSTKDWTRKFDGFRETVSFAAGQAFNTWVQIVARKV